MNKLYYDSAYIKEFEAQVLSCQEGKKGWEITLSATAFYPEGGGQPADTGLLGNVRVTDVHEKDGQVVHYTDGPLPVGEMVRGVIDWDRRFQHMQEHSGEHLVSGLIHQRFGYDNVGFHMGTDEVTIDFNGVLEWGDLMAIEEKANGMIWENLEISAVYPEKDELDAMEYRSKKELTGAVRIVSIPGGDVCACCGTHVERTGEIGLVKFLSMIHYKGGEVRDIKEGDGDIFILEPDFEAIQLRHLVNRLLEEKKGKTVLALGGAAEGSFLYVLGSRDGDMRRLSRELNGLLNGRGGGSAQMAQGTFFATKDQLQAILKEKGFMSPVPCN